jgi:hypothetical protein
MAGQRTPGPFCQVERLLCINNGVMCSSEGSCAGPVGVQRVGVQPGWNDPICGETPWTATTRALTKKWQCDDDARSEVAHIAKSYEGSLRWREDTDGVVKCGKFVDDVLSEVFTGPSGHGLTVPPRIGGWRSKLAYALERHTERPWVHDLGVEIRSGRSYPPLAGDWAWTWVEIPRWNVVEEGPMASWPGDIIGESIVYWDASGHVGIVVGPRQTASADSLASPPGKITSSDFGFRTNNDPRQHGHARDCTLRRFSCPQLSLWSG